MKPPFIYSPPSGSLDVCHKDDHLIVVNKPSGLLSVPGKAMEHRDCLEARVKKAYPETLLVHRLDMDTSGVMIFARNKNAQRHLGLQFERRYLEKTYIARVRGTVSADVGVVDLPLIVDWPNRPLQKVDHEIGKAALTEWTVLQREEGATRMELHPKTGRSHQLRVHMLAMGHPILGDRFYGNEDDVAAADRLQLHAFTLKFRHPVGGAWMSVTSECPF